MTRINKLLVLMLAVTASLFAQATTYSTTLANAITSTSSTSVNITSTTNMSAANQGAFQTVLFIDRELIGVQSINGTVLTVQRGVDGTPVSAHATTATVWYGPPTWFSQLNRDPVGTCTAAQILNLPRFYENSGNGFTCPTAGPRANQWTLQYPVPGTVLGSDNTLGGVPTGLKVCHAKYSFATDGGAVSTITPAVNCTIPINAVIWQAVTVVGATTVGSTGNVSVGLSAGAGGAAALLAATARASLTTGLMFQAPMVQTTASASNTGYVKMSAAGSVTVTIATNALTAGVLDVYIMYFDVNV